MGKIAIPKGLTGKSLFKHLVENKEDLLAAKKTAWSEGFAAHKKCNPIGGVPSYYRVKSGKSEKTIIDQIPTDADTILVKVVGNAAWWCDDQMDVLIDDNWKKSIQERQGKMHHLHDHEFKIASKVGVVQRVYSQDISLRDLGLDKSGMTQCIIWETDVMKSYNAQIFDEYKNGRINQHSISLNYVKLELAINDEEYEKEIDFWNKYAPSVINQDVINEAGFFWVVQETKIIENSCVLLGANELTPTLSISAKFDTTNEPDVESTRQEPSNRNKSTEVPFDYMKAFRETTFLKTN